MRGDNTGCIEVSQSHGVRIPKAVQCLEFLWPLGEVPGIVLVSGKEGVSGSVRKGFEGGRILG